MSVLLRENQQPITITPEPAIVAGILTNLANSILIESQGQRFCKEMVIVSPPAQVVPLSWLPCNCNRACARSPS